MTSIRRVDCAFYVVQAQVQAVHKLRGGVRRRPEGGERVPRAAQEEGIPDGGGEPARAGQGRGRSHHHQAGRSPLRPFRICVSGQIQTFS